MLACLMDCFSLPHAVAMTKLSLSNSLDGHVPWTRACSCCTRQSTGEEAETNIATATTSKQDLEGCIMLTIATKPSCQYPLVAGSAGDIDLASQKRGK